MRTLARRVKSREHLARFGIFQGKCKYRLEVWPRRITRVNLCARARAHVCVYVCAHARARIRMFACTHTSGQASPASICIPQSGMPVRKLRRLRRNPRRRHRDFRHRLCLPLRSPSPSPIKAPIWRLMFQVGWVKADTKAIQAIHDHVITHNQRVSVSHSDHSIWNLHIKGVQKEDGGLYMCQINTDPMKSQVYTALNFFKLQIDIIRNDQSTI